MFKTYSHAELSPAALFGELGTRRWQFIELELHYPWFYVELVRDYGDDIVGSMLRSPRYRFFSKCCQSLMSAHGWRRRTSCPPATSEEGTLG